MQAGRSARFDDFIVQLDGEATVLDADLTDGHVSVVGVDFQRIVLSSVELDDGPAAHAQKMVDRHNGGAELDGNVDFNLVEGFHILPDMFPAESCREPKLSIDRP